MAKYTFNRAGDMYAQRRQRRGRMGKKKRMPPQALVIRVIVDRIIDSILKE